VADGSEAEGGGGGDGVGIARLRLPAGRRYPVQFHPVFAGHHFVERHQIGARHAGVIMRRLRTIGAVLGAPAGFDAEQTAALHLVRVVVRAMSRLRAIQESRQGVGVDRLDLLHRPIVTNRRSAVHNQCWECSKNQTTSTSSATSATPMTARGPRRAGAVYGLCTGSVVAFPQR